MILLATVSDWKIQLGEMSFRRHLGGTRYSVSSKKMYKAFAGICMLQPKGSSFLPSLGATGKPPAAACWRVGQGEGEIKDGGS